MSLPPLVVGTTPWAFEREGLAAGLVAQAERAEALGLHSLWLPEHHFGGSGAIPAPLLLHAAVAARTRRLRLGTTSFLLPLRHPVHVAEEVAVLDRLSGGRVILGVGRGFRRGTFAAFDVPPEEKRSRFEAALRAVLDAWAGKPVAWEEAPGDERTPVVLSPLPVQQPHPPLWVAAFGPKALAQAGRLGLPYLASPIEPESQLARNLERHREACAEAGREPPAEVPIMRSVFVHRDAAVLRRAREGLAAQAAALVRSPAVAIRRGAAAKVSEIALVGEPEAVADEVARYRERYGMTHLIVRPQLPGLERAEVESALEEIAQL